MPSAQAFEWQNSGIWDSDSADRAFASGPSWFSAGPAWMMNAMPGAHFRARYIDRSGDIQESTADAPYVGTLHDVFDVNLFGNISTFGGAGTSKTSTPTIAALGTANNWTGVATGNVTTGTNWSLLHVPTISEDAVFTSLSAAGIKNFGGGATVGPPLIVGSFNVTATTGTYSIRNATTSATNASITLGGAGELGNGVSGTAGDLLFAATGSTFTIIGPNGGGGSGVLNLILGQSGNFDAAGTINVSSVISDGGSGFGIAKTGVGVLTLSGANTYTGLTDVQAGTLSYGGNDVTANGASLKVSGGTLDILTFSDTVAGVQLTSGTITGTTGVLTSTSAFDLQSGTVNAILGGSVGLTKTTGGTVTLSGANTYTGLTDVQAGTLAYGASNVIADGASVRISGGTFDIKTFTDTVAGVQLTSGTIAGTTGVLTSTSTFDVQAGSASAILSGSIGLTKTTAGIVTLSGANTYTGTTTISEGTLSAGSIVVASSASNLGNASSAVVLGGASTTGTVSYTGGVATYTRGFTVNSGGGGLTNAGTGLITLNTGGITIASAGTLTFITNANGITDNSTVISGAGSVTLNSAGAGALTLTPQNTYQGGTTLTQGTLTLAGSSTISANALASGPVGTGTFHIGSGTNAATIQTNITGTRTLNNNISLEGDATFATTTSSGNIVFDTIGTLTTPNSIVLTRTNQLTINSTVTLTLGGLVSGSGFGFTELGSGTINLGGGSSDTTANTYSGLTTVSGGTLSLNKGSAGTTAIAGDITINGGTLNYGQSINEQIIDSAKLTITSGSFVIGARTETIGQTATPSSGLAVSGTGAITLSSGDLIVNNSATMTGGSITLSGAGTVTFNEDFAFSGGTIDFTYAGGTAQGVLLRGGNGTGITYSASGTSTAVISNSGGGADRVSLNTTTNATTVFNIADSASVANEMTISAVITGGSTNALQKTGAGQLTLSGNNTYLGATQVNGGTLVAAVGTLQSTSSVTVNGGGTLMLSGNGRHIGANTGVTLNGGTFNTGGFSEPNGGPSGLATSYIGALTLTATSTIDFGSSNTSILEFAGLGTHTASTILQLTSWDGVPTTGGSGDRLLFAGLATTFVAAYSQSDVTFNGVSGYIAVQFDGATGNPYYEVTALAPIPEPSTWIGAALALGAIGVTQRKRFTRRLRVIRHGGFVLRRIG